MGVVYRAERVKLKRPVAVKFLNEGYAASDDGMRRFEVEARAMSRLAHPNCVGVTDFGLDQGAPYLVMDFVTGSTLREVLNIEGRLPPSRALGIVRQILAGLQHAHAQNIIHRDVKPENILITPVEGHGEQVRIVDFGLAKLRDEGSVTTGVAVGTPGYMSPEQTIGDKVDERADVYATGIILYELLTGKKPFHADSIFEVLRMHREVPPPPLEQSAPGATFSARLKMVVQQALAKPKAERFPSASAFLTALESVPELKAPSGPEAGAGGRRLWLVAAGVGIVLAGVGIGAYAFRGSGVAPAQAPAAKKAKKPTPAAVKKPAETAASATAVEPEAEDPEAPADEDAAVAEQPEPPVTAPVVAEPDDVRKLRAQAAAGDTSGAVRALESLKKKQPTRAAVHYALGNLYADMQSWQPSVKAYTYALALDPAYRSDARLIGDLVESLASDKAYTLASKLIRKELGKEALPRLDQAARSSTPKLRARARALRSQIKKG